MDKTRREKLRLLLFEDCDRQCSRCCNKYYDLKNLPVEADFTGYREIILTGGEPMLKPRLVLKTIMEIREQNPQALIFMYTAKVDDWSALIFLLGFLDSVGDFTQSGRPDPLCTLCRYSKRESASRKQEIERI